MNQRLVLFCCLLILVFGSGGVYWFFIRDDDSEENINSSGSSAIDGSSSVIDGSSTEPELTEETEPSSIDTDCVGEWVISNDCDVKCGNGQGTQTETFTITTPATGTGRACEASDGQTRNIRTTSCRGCEYLEEDFIVTSDKGKDININTGEATSNWNESMFNGKLSSCKYECDKLPDCAGFGRWKHRGDNEYSNCYLKHTTLSDATDADIISNHADWKTYVKQQPITDYYRQLGNFRPDLTTVDLSEAPIGDTRGGTRQYAFNNCSVIGKKKCNIEQNCAGFHRSVEDNTCYVMYPKDSSTKPKTTGSYRAVWDGDYMWLRDDTEWDGNPFASIDYG
jgi:hypothetical protein